MKQKDIVIIIGVAVVSAIFSYVLSNFMFGGSDKENLTSPTVSKISVEFPAPDERFFNKDSLNPTRTITIGDSQNEQPF